MKRENTNLIKSSPLFMYSNDFTHEDRRQLRVDREDELERCIDYLYRRRERLDALRPPGEAVVRLKVV